jgi:hypothetical protein
MLTLHIESPARATLLPYVPVLLNRPQPNTHLSWLREHMQVSEEAWKKSVELRGAMAKEQPGYPKAAFFPPGIHTIWDFFPPSWTCPHDVQRVGRFGDGGKWVCGMSLYEMVPAPSFSPEIVESLQQPVPAPDAGLVIYSFGISDDSSFEAEMLKRVPSARIWGYDFSVDGWGPQIPTDQRHRTFFHKIGLAKKEKPYASPPLSTLPVLMANNNHSYIDILKIDIEGSEYDALDALMDAFDGIQSASGSSVIPIGQILIEIHLDDGINIENPYLGGDVDFGHFHKWWERLERMGMRPTWMELNLPAIVFSGMKPKFTEYVLVNARDKRNVLWR